MNAHDRTVHRSSAEEAKLHYGDGEFAVLKHGRFVFCAVSGAPIPVESLRYWSAERQEAYAGAKEALQRWRELNGKG
jgi:hypothetical protein